VVGEREGKGVGYFVGALLLGDDEVGDRVDLVGRAVAGETVVGDSVTWFPSTERIDGVKLAKYFLRSGRVGIGKNSRKTRRTREKIGRQVSNDIRRVEFHKPKVCPASTVNV
jgi:hypothetical protein